MAKFVTPALGLLLIGFFPALTAALELGDIRVKSSLQQALEAEIAIEDISSSEIADVRVSLAKPALFERMQLELTPLLKQLRFQVGRTPAGEPRIFVSTQQPVKEPFLDFLLEVQWPKGQLTREFIVLLDPPTFLEQKPSPIVAPETRSAPFMLESSTGTDDEPGSKPAQGAKAGLSKIVYGAVKRGETLWRIAEKVKPENISTEQMMMALLRDNPQAFIGGNVNRLKQGAVLRLKDPTTLADINHDTAVTEAANQYRQWLQSIRPDKSRRRTAASRNDNSQIGRNPAVAPPSPQSEQARLKLVTPETKNNSAKDKLAQTTADGKTLQELQDELALANEATVVAKQENKELSQRLDSLQKQMAQMQHLLELKTRELESARSRPEADISPKPESPIAIELSGEKPASVPAVKPDRTNQKEYKPFWQDPYLLGIIGSAVFLVFFMAWLLIRARRNNIEPDSLEAELAKQQHHAHPGEHIGLEPLTELVQDDSLWLNESEIDPLIEADLYLLYERFDKAEELLQTAIKSDPTRNELKLKLLETLYKQQDLDRFESMAEEFYAVLDGDERHPLWQQVIGFAQELGSDNPIVASHNAVLDSPTPEQTQGEAEQSLFTQQDEVGSQLDLAKAYIEMGDTAGAQELLDKVLAMGNESQKEQVRELKKLLG